MYWTSPEIAQPPAGPAWKDFYPEFRVFSDDDVIPLIPESFVPVYKSIRLPSAKSDIARFFLLREYGGLYVDAHVGPTSPWHLLETLDKLSVYNVIVFGKGWAMPTEADFDLMNGVVAARKGAPELDTVIDLMIHNILDQKSKEDATKDYVPYSLFGLTGTYVLVQSYFDQVPPRPQIKAHLKDKVFAHFMKDNKRSGFEIASHYTYRKPNGHWSERQQHERFFVDEG
ncbi:glycosyltransferase [Methylobacterium sp. J-068]|uniref:glycosyltransferase n=1 Tax=Methylobacterium sp. J-068 TaxID=2836649 RepID=UPI001FB9B0EA|nr:glycosyltransferase [Methylobacterium sp. J-068]MCJ2034178.1 hypothetical protein [Methylobacterium sp. J-068]